MEEEVADLESLHLVFLFLVLMTLKCKQNQKVMLMLVYRAFFKRYSWSQPNERAGTAD